MPPRPRPLPPGLGPVFSRRDALVAGATARRLRAKDLETPFRGARICPAAEPSSEDEDDQARALLGDAAFPADRRDDSGSESAARPLARDRATRRRVLRMARAYREVMEPEAFFAGRTSAVIHSLPVDHDDDLEVAVIAPRRAPRRHGIRGRKVARQLVHVTESHGLPVASPASTWAMLATECTVRGLIVIGDAIVRVPRDDKGRPQKALATIEQLSAAVDAGRRPGVARLRAAQERIRVGSSSPLETEFRLDAEDAGLPEPELDVEIRDAEGRLLGISEFVYRAFRVIVEVEGDHHRTSRAQWNRDIEKYAAYAEAGWEVVRLTSAHIRGRSPRAAGVVGQALRRHGWTP